MDDVAATGDQFIASLLAQGRVEGDNLKTIGVFHAVFTDKDGNVFREDTFQNLVVTVGKNFLLDQSLAGSAYTATEYMSLIAGASAPTIAAADTMGSHAGWAEASGASAGYGTTRPTCAWSAASGGAKALSAALSYVFTNAGTIQGGFVVGGSGASATVGNTGGVLVSAGTLTGGAQPVIAGNTLTLSYSLTLT